jgi:hypothetical protein
MLSEETDNPYIRIRGTKLGERYKIANVLTPVYDGSFERETEETRANARLIAGAPELLAVLQELCDMADDGDVACWVAEWDKARAAIAKANGR